MSNNSADNQSVCTEYARDPRTVRNMLASNIGQTGAMKDTADNSSSIIIQPVDKLTMLELNFYASKTPSVRGNALAQFRALVTGGATATRVSTPTCSCHL